MTIDEFTNEIGKIERFYEKEIPEEQKKYWYQELKSMDAKRFKTIIGQVFRINKFLPKLADIIEINSNLGYSQTEKPKTNNCTKCKGTGYIVYSKFKQDGERNLEYQYMAICQCGLKKKFEGWNVKDDKNKSNYYIPLASELGL